MRVQIPAYTDMWMRGDRFGELVRITTSAKDALGKPDATELRKIAHVRMDKSGKVVRVLLNDCEVL